MMMSHFFFAFKSAFFFDFVRYFHQRGRDLRGEGRRNERARFFRSLSLSLSLSFSSSSSSSEETDDDDARSSFFLVVVLCTHRARRARLRIQFLHQKKTAEAF